jgi:peptidoglycan/xylan/chitin deacetylase (PgdA/CDA1 family)
MSTNLLILGWHNVEGTPGFPSAPELGRQGFSDQLRLLRRLGHVVDLKRALSDLAEGRSLPSRAVALTFDDGYRDSLTIATPLLRELELPATFFLIPNVLSGTTVPWWEVLSRAFQETSHSSLDWDNETFALTAAVRRSSYDAVCARLKRLDEMERQSAVGDLVDRLEPEHPVDVSGLFLDWDGARELVRQGITIGAHSLDHAILANESPEAQRTNLSTARRDLQDQLEVEVDLLAYPNGGPEDFDAVTQAAAQEAGYRCGITTIPGLNSASTSMYGLRRYLVSPERGRRAFKWVVKHMLLDRGATLRRAR